MNLPNRITLIRIILIPFIIFFYLSEGFLYGGKMIATGLFFVGIATDFLDGYLARKRGEITVLGTFLDSIADKMFVITTLLLIVADGTVAQPFGVIFAVIIIARELMVSALRQLGASRNVIISADYFGKVKATFQFVSLFLFMLYSFLNERAIFDSNILSILYWICFAGLALTTILTIMSGCHYLIKNRNLFSETQVDVIKKNDEDMKDQKVEELTSNKNDDIKVAKTDKVATKKDVQVKKPSSKSVKGTLKNKEK